MEFRHDPFFADAAPPVMPRFPHVDVGSARRAQRQQQQLAPFQSVWGGGGGVWGGGGGGGVWGGGGGMLMPFGGHNPFSMMSGMMMNGMMMNGMMMNMDNMMQRAASQGGCYSSSSTTVMQYSSDGSGGQPRMYHASTSTRQGPGGVKETRKAVKDSHTGVQKMAVGHHIGDRSHVIERQVNTQTGDRAENQEFINLDESDADPFNEEWREKTRPLNHTHLHPSLEQSRRRHFSNARGLPSTSRPPHPTVAPDVGLHRRDPEVHIVGARDPEVHIVGARATKRRHRTSSSSGAEDELSGSTPHSVITSRSPKMIRTKSPPYVAGWVSSAAQPQSHSHSSHAHHLEPASTSTSAKNDAEKDVISESTAAKKKGKKTTTFAL